MDCVTAPGLSRKSIFTSLPTSICTRSAHVFSKPAFSTVMEYIPARYPAHIFPGRIRLQHARHSRRVFAIVTFAPDIAPPLASVTCAGDSPCAVCARLTGEKSTAQIESINVR